MHMLQRPFFAVCFIFSTIPFWVPLIALLSGTDPVLMIMISILSVMAKAYVDSEIAFRHPLGVMAKYFLAAPVIFSLKLIAAVILTLLLTIYGMKGEPLDKGIAALLIVYFIIQIYFRPKRGYWNIKGLGVYRFYSFAGKLFNALLWIAFFTLPLGTIDAVAVACTAVLVYSLTFFKVNEGLL